MPDATDEQVQAFSDQQVRPFCESINLKSYRKAVHARATIEDVYNRLNQPSPNWTDDRTDGPPHLAEPNDILAINTFMFDLIAFCEGHAQWAIVEKLCVQVPEN